jgi:rod shape-determining protein MreC
VLLINDQTSGAGVILDKSRLQGVLRGTPSGEVVIEKVMSDETVPAGELVLTSGGDGVFPKGLPVGRVTKASGNDLFLNIHVRPSANLSKLEEVLVVTKIDERQAQPDRTGAARAVDILAERLPGVPSKPENDGKAAAPGAATPGTAAPATTGSDAKPKATPPQASASNVTPVVKKPANAAVPGGTGPANSSAIKATAPDAAKIVPKPVKAVVEPKPQPAAEDAPH